MRKLLQLIIIIGIGLIPFLWLSPGWIDIGGDSSRLYLYDPLQYLKSFPLFGTEPTGVGPEQVSYYMIPFVALLAVLKSMVGTSHLLITLVNSLTLIIAYASVYATMMLLLDRRSRDTWSVILASTTAGLFYILTPLLTHTGWDKALVVHNQFFINPLMVFLLLSYIHTRRFVYVATAIIVSFLFSANFSPSPYFFAFYPVVSIFLIMYAIVVRPVRIPLRHIIAAGVSVVGLHAFHLLPFVRNVFTVGSSFNTSAFSSTGKFIRGLSYFEYVARNTTLTKNLTTLPQLGSKVPIGIEPLWFVFPALLILGLLQYRRMDSVPKSIAKRYLLVFTWFLFLVFVITGNVSTIGLAGYKAMFHVPGFAMFRNYVGQFSFIYAYFYTLLLGFSLYFVFQRLAVRKTVFVTLGVIVLLVGSSWQFIRGDMIDHVINQDAVEEVTVPIRMDPSYEEVLTHVRTDPVDGKYISFPYMDTGWQILSGVEGGAYMGPPMISYVGGKRDFAGYASLAQYKDDLFEAASRHDYAMVNRILGILNIRSVFHNADPKIYDATFPSFPYSGSREFFPANQDGYQAFIENLDVTGIADYGEMYTIFQTSDAYYLPHIYAATRVFATNQPKELAMSIHAPTRIRDVTVPVAADMEVDNTVLMTSPTSPLVDLQDNAHLHVHRPHVSKPARSIFYPFVVLKERYDLSRQGVEGDAYLNFSLLLMSKRIEELRVFGKEMESGFDDVWIEPAFWQVYRWNTYDSWNAALQMYAAQADVLLHWIAAQNVSGQAEQTMYMKVYHQFLHHEADALAAVQDNYVFSPQDKARTSQEIQGVFDTLIPQAKHPAFSAISALSYEVSIPEDSTSSFAVEIHHHMLPEGPVTLTTPEQTTLVGQREHDRAPTVFGAVNLESGTTNTFDLTVPRRQLPIQLVADQKETVPVTNASLVILSDGLLNATNGQVVTIDEWVGNTQYAVSFEYNTGGENFFYRLQELQRQSDTSLVDQAVLLSQAYLRSTDWQQHHTIVTADRDAIGAFIQFASDTQKVDAALQVRNLTVTEVVMPVLVLRSATTRDQIHVPSITFQKINRTKYRIDVDGASDPYTLVFLDAYNPKWKIYLRETHESGPRYGRWIGTMLSPVLTTLGVQDAQEPDIRVEASYFNGQVREGSHTSTFLSADTFETYGLAQIAAASHIPINDYANGWTISPQDVDGRDTYTLILEFQTQRDVYLWMFVAALSFVSLSLSTVIVLVRARK